MVKDQVAKITDSFISGDLSSMENMYETVYSMVLEAIGTGTAKEVKEQFSDFYEKEEQLSEIMGVMDSSDTEMKQATVQYWFGQIKALTDLLSGHVKQEQERQDFLELSKCSKHLNACLFIINEHPRISGTDLKQQLLQISTRGGQRSDCSPHTPVSTETAPTECPGSSTKNRWTCSVSLQS